MSQANPYPAGTHEHIVWHQQHTPPPERRRAAVAAATPQIKEHNVETIGQANLLVKTPTRTSSDGHMAVYGEPLLAKGYLPVPIARGSKRPVGNGWQKRRMTLDDVRRASKAGIGAGILCGQGEHPMAGVDVDVKHAGLAEAVHAFCRRELPGTVERVGDPPKTLFVFRAPRAGMKKRQSASFIDPANPTKPDGKSLVQKIEILGDGQQFVAYHEHPDTRRPYKWVDLLGGLAAVDAADLPVLTDVHVDALFAEFERLAVEQGMTRHADGSTKAATPRAVDDFEREIVLAGVTDATIKDLREALKYIDPEDHDKWVNTGHALSGLGEVGRELWLEYSLRGSKFDDGLKNPEATWNTFTGDRTDYRAVFAEAQRGGWVNPRSNDAPEGVRQPATRDALDEARRAAQIAENRAIGDGDRRVPVAEKMTLDAALARFVLIADGSRVADTLSPNFDLALLDWANNYAASRHLRPARRPDGRAKLDAEGKPVVEAVPVTKAWAASPQRMTVIARTFKAGGPLTLLDPQGRLSLNSWRPYDRNRPVSDDDRRRAGVFFDHVGWLWGDAADPFIDWLAHIEQQPGVLPHTAWLHVARRFGLGRNWICSVLTRLWSGKVAANVDFTALLSSGFNGALAGKVLAYVDEIREGARDSAWQHAEPLKSVITAETRLLNPKYGRQSVEFNACRWLFLSNHDSAIPIEQSDRRIEVARCDDAPRAADYYTKLYAALNDPGFIAGIAALLAERDISGFNPGAHARLSAAKLDVVGASLTPEAEWCQRAIEHWPSDLIIGEDLRRILIGEGRTDLPASCRRVLEQHGVRRLDRKVRVKSSDGEGTRTVPVWALRNAAHWLGAGAAHVYNELAKVQAEAALHGTVDAFGDASPRELIDVLGGVLA